MSLSDAARNGDIHRVQELLSIGVSRVEKNEALKGAASRGHIQIVELLLNANANPNTEGALYWATKRGRIQIVQMLLNAGADPNKRTFLRLAAYRGHIQIVEILLNAGANPNNEEALYWAVHNDDIQIFELLLAAGANIKMLPEDQQEQFKHLVLIYISIQEYLMLEPLVINILELKDRFIIDIVSNKKYVVLKLTFKMF